MAARALLLIALLALAACAPFAPAAVAPTAAHTEQPATEQPASPTIAPPAAPTTAATPSPAPASAAQQALFIGVDRQVRAATQRNRTIATVGQLPADVSPLWIAPNGEAVAFIAGDGRLTVQVLVSGERYPLTPPDVRIETDGLGVLLPDAQPSTGGATSVPSTTVLLDGLSFSSAGDALLYSIDRSDDFFQNPQPQLFLATFDGAPPRLVGFGIAPSFSPAGDRIAYLGPPFLGSPPFGGGVGGHVMLANAAGGAPRAAGAEQDVYGSWAPLVWSDDGARLGAGTQLIDAASGNVVARAPANDHVMIDGIQRVAPDGKSFLYWRNQRFSDSSAAGFHELDELLLVSEDGTARPLIRRPPNECPCLPVGGEIHGWWAPSGSRIALADEQLGLRLYTGDGTPIGRLPLPHGAQLTGDAFWSGDEGRLLVSLTVDKHTEAWLLDTRSGQARKLGAGVALGWGL